jgi:hypothetical protein
MKALAPIIHTNELFQIFPTKFRARGLNFAASGGAIGSIVVAQVWPVGIANIGSKVYFFFMAINLVCIPIIYLFYPETNGRTLEDMDMLFKGRHASSLVSGSAGEESPEYVSAAPAKQAQEERYHGI